MQKYVNGTLVVDGENALNCTSCHYNTARARFDWKKLGYEGDPIKIGSRFK